MTVAELIEKLKEMPQDMEVYDWNYYPVEAPIVKKIEFCRWALRRNAIFVKGIR